MSLYKNISGYKIKINDRLIYPNQTIKLNNLQYNNYIDKQNLLLIDKSLNKEVISQEVEISPNKEIVSSNIEQPQLKRDITVQIDVVSIVSILSDINNTLNDIRLNMANMTVQTNIVNHDLPNHNLVNYNLVDKEEPIKPVQIFDNEVENDLLSNLLENSIR